MKGLLVTVTPGNGDMERATLAERPQQGRDPTLVIIDICPLPVRMIA